MRYQVLMLDVPHSFFQSLKFRFQGMDVNFTAALTLQNVVDLCKNQQIHLVILKFPDSAMCSEFLIVLRRICTAPIIVILEKHDVKIARSALQSGADLCVGMQCSVDLTVDHIMAQFRRYTGYDQHSAQERQDFQIGDIYIDPARCVVRVKERSVRLRPREFQLLHYFMKHPDEVLSAERICENAWNMEVGYGRGISQPIYLLRQAIESNPEKPRYIHTVHRVGYRFTPNYVETCDECDSIVREL